MWRTGSPPAAHHEVERLERPGAPRRTGATTAGGDAGVTPMTPRVTVSIGFDSSSGAGDDGERRQRRPSRSTVKVERSPGAARPSSRRSEK